MINLIYLYFNYTTQYYFIPFHNICSFASVYATSYLRILNLSLRFHHYGMMMIIIIIVIENYNVKFN